MRFDGHCFRGSNSTTYIGLHIHLLFTMVAQANNTGTSKNTTNEKEKNNNDSATLHT